MVSHRRAARKGPAAGRNPPDRPKVLYVIAKVLSFYRFTELADPATVRLWQRELCRRLGLTGRIIVSTQGINGTVGGDLDDLKQYLKATREHEAFTGLVPTWTQGTGNDFPRLSVKVRPELVTFGVPGEVELTSDGVAKTGTHLTPSQVHELVENRGSDVVFFDGRNAWEAEVGKFAGAVVTESQTTSDFVAELDSGRYDDIKDRPVVTYCTGGIRCEVLSSLMVERGFNNVYQIDGGILAYGHEYGDKGLWEGALRVFDDREVITFSDSAKVIGRCSRCAEPTSRHVDCTFTGCKGRSLICPGCAERDAHCAQHVGAATGCVGS